VGRLFWKFFLFFWLAQVLTVIVVGVTIWVMGPGEKLPRMAPPAPSVFSPAPPPPPSVEMEQPPPPPMGAGRMEISGGEMAPPDGPAMGGPPPTPEDSISPPLLPLIAGSLVSLLFAALLAHYFSRPIRTLRKAFDAAANGDLDTRIGSAMAHRRDELSALGADFDRMAEHLQALVKGKQRLLHDVSHELRSPLARLQAVIDLIQQQPERLEELIARIGRESDRIDRLVGELLTLARLDSGLPGSQAVAVDLAEIIGAIADDAAFEAETKQCRVDVRLPEKSRMTGYPGLLHRAIENIVRNAVRHTPEGSTISVRGETNSEGNWLFLHVMDEGKGVSEEVLKLIFEPFYRSGSADRFQGYGIGMAITRRVVEAHGGEVTVKNREQGGLQVTMKFPLSAEEAG
jgi:signal transduction histidine kinase